MKKIKALITFVIFIIFCMCFQVSAGSGRIIVGNAGGNTGNEVRLDIYLEDNPGIITMKLEISFDAKKLKLVRAEDGNILGENYHSDKLISPYTLFWLNPYMQEDIKSNGKIATLVFQVRDGAEPGDIAISIVEIQAYNNDLKKVEYVAVSGVITVNPEGSVPTTDSSNTEPQTESPKTQPQTSIKKTEPQTSIKKTEQNTAPQTDSPNTVPTTDSQNSQTQTGSHKTGQTKDSQKSEPQTDSQSDKPKTDRTVILIAVIIVVTLLCAGIIIYIMKKRGH